MNSFDGTHPPPSTAPRKTLRRRRLRGGGPPSTRLQHRLSYNNKNKNESKKHLHFPSDAGVEDEAKFSGGGQAVELSARKLAARLWRLRSLLYGIGVFCDRSKSSHRSRFKCCPYLERKLGEERTSQQRKEHDKICALIDDLKGRLIRERKKQQKMDVCDSQLIKQLAEAKISSMQSVKKYEAEKRTRKLLEEACRELAKKSGDDEAVVESMRIETMKIREGIEEERNMVHIAEVWREERVQMKLIDAKLALESKYSQLNNLITGLETFLSSTSLIMRDLRKAEVIVQLQAVKAVSIQEPRQIEVQDATAIEASPNTGSNGECSISSGQPKLRTLYASSSEAYNVITDEGTKGRLSSGRVSCPRTYLPYRKSINGSLKHQKPMAQYDSTDLVNPHVTRGMGRSI
ncbi:hypothetical protein F3Y22_tig00001478pilonHSYRG00300 [Hibiscus syriacus]|uniref:Uncharacterized protein n=1 Tax=Hibiscus syriacus TaxID=106335 RepID=A0A6A3D0C6_HIBSY|nr:hypothetical protein F3Y22_tig00001478pilonHSYRG00300 [Hibiscus syriacus]